MIRENYLPLAPITHSTKRTCQPFDRLQRDPTKSLITVGCISLVINDIYITLLPNFYLGGRFHSFPHGLLGSGRTLCVLGRE